MIFDSNREENETETEKTPIIPPATTISTTSTTTPKPTTTSTTTTTTPKPSTTSTTTSTTPPPTTTSSTTPKPTIPRRYPYYPRPNYRPRTTTSTAAPRRPFNYPTYPPRRPEYPFTPTEVTVNGPRDPFVVTAERQPDGGYGINTSDIPKDTWSVLSEKDKPEDDFNPNDLHCLDGYERNDRGECVGMF